MIAAVVKKIYAIIVAVGKKIYAKIVAVVKNIYNKIVYGVTVTKDFTVKYSTLVY